MWLIRWKQDLLEDPTAWHLLAALPQVDAARDAKLAALRDMSLPANAPTISSHDGNRQRSSCSAFSDTAHFSTPSSPLGQDTLGMHAAVVTGSAGGITLPGLRKSLGDVLSAFAPAQRSARKTWRVKAKSTADRHRLHQRRARTCKDCDWLINYDIHWNPVRIIQRFGRIDRIGSPNQRIQLVNFWPNMELEEYINLEQRVGGRMVLLDVSATGEENLIEQQSGNAAMNDLEYRRKQLAQASGHGDRHGRPVFSAWRSPTSPDRLPHRPGAAPQKATPAKLDTQPLGAYASPPRWMPTFPRRHLLPANLRPGGKVRNIVRLSARAHYLVHVGDDGHRAARRTAGKRITDRLKRRRWGANTPDDSACAVSTKTTKGGEDVRHARSCSLRRWPPSRREA